VENAAEYFDDGQLDPSTLIQGHNPQVAGAAICALLAAREGGLEVGRGRCSGLGKRPSEKVWYETKGSSGETTQTAGFKAARIKIMEKQDVKLYFRLHWVFVVR
jgi:hypothetical protein